jgi:hypothetical protein
MDFQKLRAALTSTARRIFDALADPSTLNKETAEERAMRLLIATRGAAEKLGLAHFTRQLPPRTRAARIARLNKDERMVATMRGWIAQ